MFTRIKHIVSIGLHTHLVFSFNDPFFKRCYVTTGCLVVVLLVPYITGKIMQIEIHYTSIAEPCNFAETDCCCHHVTRYQTGNNVITMKVTSKKHLKLRNRVFFSGNSMPVSRARSHPVPGVVAGSGTMQISNIMDVISIFIHITHECMDSKKLIMWRHRESDV